MDYSFFLFSKLADFYLDTNYAYDDLYKDLSILYESYENSEYNVGTKPEYECMLDFFESTDITQLI